MVAMLKCVVIILNTFLISSYLTLNIELVIGLSLMLVFFIIYEGSRKIGLSGTFLAVCVRPYQFVLLSKFGLLKYVYILNNKKIKIQTFK